MRKIIIATSISILIIFFTITAFGGYNTYKINIHENNIENIEDNLIINLNQGSGSIGFNMNIEKIHTQRSTSLRKNNSQELIINIGESNFKELFLINGSSFITEGISIDDLVIHPNSYYMIINVGRKPVEIQYNLDISNHKIIYDPFKHESSQKINLKQDLFQKTYDLPDGFVDTLPKWYSFKFTYPEYNIIFVKPQLGISIQFHQNRAEYWEILEGNPIIINGGNVYYFVEKGTKFTNSINTYHSIINPNKEKFVAIKEYWSGKFKETDITRVFNPNHYG